MVLDMDMDLQHMESDPRDGHIEPRSNLHQLPVQHHHRRGRSHDHSSYLQPVDIDLDLDHDLRHQVLEYRPQQPQHHNPDSNLPSQFQHPEPEYHEHNHNHSHDHRYSLPPASYAAANHDSIAANAHHAFTPVNPDDFYQSYRALHLANNPDILPMATSVPRPSLRSNGDGTTPKHPVVTTNRNLRGNLRSASNPVDNRPAGLPYKPSTSPGHPSVRDLKKRFDQNGGSSSIPRAPTTHLGAAARAQRDGGPSTQPRNGTTSYSNLRAGAAQDSSPDLSNSSTSPRPQRAKFVAEDQVSSNSQSFASRIGKPRSSVSENPNASKSLTNLPPKSPPQQQPQHQFSTSPTSSRAQGLLFGEILPEQHDSSIAGYGIDSIRRRTSESGLPNPWSHQRSLSDPDAEPSSPSSWYRNIHGEGIDGQSQPDPAQKGHSRSQSDVPTSRSALPVVRKPASRRPPSSNGSVSGSVSKLPRSVRKLSSPTGSESASSTRSNSPSTFRRPRTNGRTSRTGASTNRAKTPTSQPKSSAQTPSGRKSAPRALVTPSSSNNRLQANIIAPPPKLSPPLRSSRPRQPVSMATTASSRNKAVERARSPNPLSRPPTKIAEPSTRRRKISVGPIDFEQRREHIRLAYTKSIRESQALEARQKAADRRRKEMEAAAKAKAAAAAAAVAATSPSEHEAPSVVGDHNTIPASYFQPDSAEVSPTQDVPPVPVIPAIHSNPPVQEHAINERAEPTSGLHILGGDDHGRDTEATVDTFGEPSPAPSSIVAADIAAALPPIALASALPSQVCSPATEPSSIVFESPALGVPGSFPLNSPSIDTHIRPQTALSATSDATEFEDESQTNSPIRPQSPLEVPITIVKPPSPQTSSNHHPRVEYMYPFEEEPDSSDRVETSQDTVQEVYQPKSIQSGIDSPTIPGAFNDELYADHAIRSEVQSPFETTITILPPPDDIRTTDREDETVPFPRMEASYESDFHSEMENDHEPHNHHDAGDATTDVCTEGTDEHHRTDDCRSELQYDDQLSSHRASTCESSDAGVGDELRYSNYDQQAPGTSRSLTVPKFRTADRLSQQSAWTDFSIESGDYSDNNRSPMLQDDEDDGSAPLGHATIFETRSIHRESRLPSRPRELQHSQSEVRPSMDSTRSFNLFGNHQLPELDTGDGFTIPYLSQRASKSYTYVPSPNHEPPPIPTPASGSVCNSQRASAVFYDQSQYGSTLINSERGSEEYMPTMATPQSIDTASGGTPEQYFPSSTAVDGESKAEVTDKNEPSAKEKSRLVQRRNVIKELIDTEAVFVRDMSIVEEIYKGTAEACPKLDGNTSKLIFRNTDEIIEFHTSFLTQLKEAVVSVYAPQIRRSALSREGSFMSEPGQFNAGELDDDKDRATAIGPVFKVNMEKMKLAHEGFLRNSDQAAKRLIQIQQDPTVKVWLNECNEVAKDLTAAWDLDSLLIKPMQRITKYPNLIITLLGHTPADHPDREALVAAKDSLETAIIEINKTKKNFELVGQIVGRKRKESDVKAGFARAFGKRVDKLQASGNRPPEDPDYAKYNEKFGDDYLRLQVVLRDVEFYTRQVSAYVHEFLQYLSSIELVMRIQPGSYPELESKWVQFNISIRDLEKVALEDHLSQVRKHVIEPFELVIKAYGNPSLAMKKRQKRRLDFERYEQLKRSGKSADAKLKENVEQYEALNDTLKKELPKLSALTEKVGNICLGNFVNIQVKWYGIWKDKMKVVLGDTPDIPDLKEVVSTFQRDFPYAQEQIANIGILNPVYRGRMSQSTTASVDESLLKVRSRPSDIDPIRARGLSLNGDQAPILPVPDFTKRNSGSFTMSPTSMGPPTAGPSTTGLGTGPMPSPHHYYYRDYYNGLGNSQHGAVSPMSPAMPGSSQSFAASTRPSTGRSFDSGGMPRQSSDSATHPPRDSNTTYSSTYNTPQQQEARRFSGLFHSALPLPDGPEESQRSSRASSRERGPTTDGYNVLWLAASLFEFNIATTKHEAGYPYLIYQAGEIFDVIAEKGELWLAKNQDDPSDQVGWIWSKHFAKLADA